MKNDVVVNGDSMNNRVIGIVGVEALYSNFNADFTGSPKKLMEDFNASPFSLKYSCRKFMEFMNYPIFYIKSFYESKGRYKLRNLNDRYEFLFNDKVTKETSLKDIYMNLLSCVDIMNFGATATFKENNISIPGAVQITEGINLYEDAVVVKEEVLSPFSNSNKIDAKQSTIGSRKLLDEAHFFFGVSVLPNQYDFIKNLFPDFKGYTKEAYDVLKKSILCGVNLLKSVSKSGCRNEFGIFITFKEGSLAYETNLHSLVKFYKDEDEDKGIIDISGVVETLSYISDEIDNIEVYFNPSRTTIKYSKYKELDESIKSLIKEKNIIRVCL